VLSKVPVWKIPVFIGGSFFESCTFLRNEIISPWHPCRIFGFNGMCSFAVLWKVFAKAVYFSSDVLFGSSIRRDWYRFVRAI